MKKPFFKTFIGNLIIVGVLTVALYWIFFGSLSLITRHNDVQIVPALKGKTVKEAIATLEKKGFEIEVDSVYDASIKPLMVIDQLPIAGSTVKSGRKVLLTVNKALAPLVELPNFNTMSLRTALLALKRNNLTLGDTTFEYDISYNTILAMMINGKPVKPGTKVPIGTKIDFKISAGLSDVRVKIPYLLGMSYAEVIKTLDELKLKYVLALDDYKADTNSVQAYTQMPEDRNLYGEPQYLYQGEIVDVRFKLNPEIPKRTFTARPVNTPVESTDFDNLHQHGTNTSDSNAINPSANPRQSTNPNSNTENNPTPTKRPERNPTPEPNNNNPSNSKPASKPNNNNTTDKNKSEPAPPKESKPLRPTRN